MISLTFIGTATTLLRLGDVTLLTDPNFLQQGERAYLGKGLWSRRLTQPALQPRDLPPLDGVVLSHLHGDHWDRVARRELPKALPVLTTNQAAKHLRKQGFGNATGLATGQSESVTGGADVVRVTAQPGQHGRGHMQALLPPVMGSLIELERPGAQPFRLYITGDTLLVPAVAAAARCLPALDAVLVHTGGTRVLGALVTLDDREGCDLLELLTYRRAVPIHYDDYGAFKTSLPTFVEHARQRGLGDRLSTVVRGQTLDLEK